MTTIINTALVRAINHGDYANAKGNFVDLIVNDVKVQLSWIGEGISGVFNEDDADFDEPMLRFSVLKNVKGKWLAVDDASHCTELSAKCSADILGVAANYVMKSVYHDVVLNSPVKRMCQKLSHLDEYVFRPAHIAAQNLPAAVYA